MRNCSRHIFFLTVLLAFLSCLEVYGQKVSAKLRFTPGDSISVKIELKATVTQQAMGNAISFDTDASALYRYLVLDANNIQSRLRHEGQRIVFSFDGMGRKYSFDSDRPADIQGQFGEPVKEILARKFDMVIDEYGHVLSTQPDSLAPLRASEQLETMMGVMRDLSDLVSPPRKLGASLFGVLPKREIEPGDTWTDSLAGNTGEIKTSYMLTGVTDSTLLIDFTSVGQSVTSTMLMGRETVTTLSSTGTGKIVVDRKTGMLKEKIQNTDYSGAMEAMGNSTPLTSKTTLRIFVNKER